MSFNATSIFPEFLSLLNRCSLDDKKAMLEFLRNDIMEAETSALSKVDSYDIKNIFSPLSYQKWVSQREAFVDDEIFLNYLGDELESLGLYSPQSSKPKTMSFALSSNDCTHNGRSQAVNDLSKFPAISKLLKMVSSHELINKELDFCNVICYSSDKKSIRLHADNEDYIDQTCPIATFSLGATRTVEFVPFGSSPRNTVISVESKHNSLYVMKPGCQCVLQHRVTPGNSKDHISNQVRYSISFRKFRADSLPLSTPSAPSICTISQPNTSAPSISPISQPNTSSKTYTTLIVGDSFVALLDPNKLAKGRKNVINLAKGGNKIPDVINSIENFLNNNCDNTHVDQVFVSVGTNDIRNCRGEDVLRLKGDLYRLVRFIKNVFHGAKIFFQSLIPLPITIENGTYIVKNILSFNKMIFDTCKHERIFFLDVFGIFLLVNFRNPLLFSFGFRDIYPNKRGLGLLAREYIDRIHCRHFNPLISN